MKPLNIIQALSDGHLLGQFIKPDSWGAWHTLFRAFYALPPQPGDIELFKACTGRTEWPTVRANELWVISGRRSGKSINASLLAAFLAAFQEYPMLSRGERGTIPIISPTRTQSKIIKNYVSGFFSENPYLSTLLDSETAWEINLRGNITISIMTADFRSIRGFTCLAGLLDESAFFQTEGSVPDSEVIRALRPALITTKGPLISISSPYAKRGALFDAYKRYYGKAGDVLVWQSPSIVMNPTLDNRIIEKAKAEDLEGASSEWDAVFRSDIESYISREAVESCIVPGRYELPPVLYAQYQGFVDPSGGQSDSMTLGISHFENGRRILDLIREVKPPFSPDEVCWDFSEDLKRYKISKVQGDKYAGIWPVERFQEHGIEYEQSAMAKSDIYKELLPLINSGEVELLDNPKLVTQLVNLERRTGRGGRDSIDHPPGGHDDVINSAAGCLVNAQAPGDMEFFAGASTLSSGYGLHVTGDYHI